VTQDNPLCLAFPLVAPESMRRFLAGAPCLSPHRRCVGGASQLSSASDDARSWFNAASLRARAASVSVSRSQTLLPCIPSTSLSHREKMLAERKAIVGGGDPKKAERALRKAAVLVPLCLKEGKPAVLFTVRSNLVSTHKGQVSFPGGHIEEGEAPPAAAVREAVEELGADLGPIRLVARCTAVPAITGTIVHPVVGFLERDVGPAPHGHLDACAAEVDRIFALSLDELYDPALNPQRGDPKRGRSGRWPVFLGDPGGAEVWGLTAFILRAVLHDLVTPLRPKAPSAPGASASGAQQAPRLGLKTPP